ncbi:MAG: hypothetical protein ACFFD9_09755, partial [Candidatus Thorarchaeota archaeon]
MPRFRRKPILFGVALLGALILLYSASLTVSQPPGWFGDDHVHAYIAINGVSITATSQTAPIEIDLDTPTSIDIEIDVVGSDAIFNLNGTISFFYQSIRIFELFLAQNDTVAYLAPPDPILPVHALIDFGSILRTNLGGLEIDLITGQFEASVSLLYLLEGETVGVDPPHRIEQLFFLVIPPGDVLDAITSVAGIATVVATGGAVVGVGVSIKNMFDGLSTAHKLRSIQKKASEIRSLPDLTVLGALPALFSIVAGMVKVKKKKDEDIAREAAEGQEGVSEYIVRQRVREIAPEAWRRQKCPNCRAKWREGAKTCKKCHIDIDDAEDKYADLLASRVDKALRVMSKKKSLSIRKLAKRTKSSEYNAGVLGAAMVDTEVTEIQKIETPLRSFVMNIGGLAFLILTWQQLLGGAASQFQTTLTVVGGALSLGVIVALYLSRRTQIRKLQEELDEKGIEVT